MTFNSIRVGTIKLGSDARSYFEPSAFLIDANGSIIRAVWAEGSCKGVDIWECTMGAEVFHIGGRA